MLIGRLFGYPGLDIENKCWLLLGKYHLDMLVLTCGVNGSYVFAPNLKSFQETPAVEVADTVGQVIPLRVLSLQLSLQACQSPMLIS